PQLSDGRKLRVGILGVIGRQAGLLLVGDRQYLSWDIVAVVHRLPPSLASLCTRAGLHDVMRRPQAHEMPCQACTTISQSNRVYQKTSDDPRPSPSFSRTCSSRRRRLRRDLILE